MCVYVVYLLIQWKQHFLLYSYMIYMQYVYAGQYVRKKITGGC